MRRRGYHQREHIREKNSTPFKAGLGKSRKVGDWKVFEVGAGCLKDYDGMNAYAGKAMGFKPKLKKDEVLVDRRLKASYKKEVVAHEIIEARLMKRGMHYWTAHNIALKTAKEGIM